MKSLANKVETVLDLDRKIVGVKFLFDAQTFEACETKQVKHKMSYCNTVRLATHGHGFKAEFNNFLCKASARALGLLEPDNHVISGQDYYSFNMYNSIATAKGVQKEVTFINHEIYGVQVMPLEKFQSKPDMVIMIMNPYQSMRIVQGYSYHHGIAKNIKLTGNQGLCSECTATPYENNDINISMLCANTRFAADWKDHEVGAGMPYALFERVADGLIKTIEGSDSDVRKEKIIKRLADKNIDLPIDLGTSYYKSGRKNR